VRAVASSWLGEPGEGSKPTGWDRARLGVVVPLCVVVTVAIVCMIVAALTSARRADEVAIENETQLLTRAIANHGEWSLRRLKTVVATNAAQRARAIETNPAQAQGRIKSWFSSLLDHDLVLVFNSRDQIVYTQIGGTLANANWVPSASPQLHALIGHVRGHSATAPRETIRLVGSDTLLHAGPSEAVFLQILAQRLATVATAPIGGNDDATWPAGVAHPLVLTVRFVELALLNNIGDRLQLANLRMIDDRPAPATDHVLKLTDTNKKPIAVFAWTPKRPGAEIMQSVVPFISIALAGFAVLAGLVLRYMRRTAATITAGENRLRYLALHDPMCGLPNRIFFGERLEVLIAEVKRGGPAAALFYIDLDHFKDVNDTLGHPVGDELIRSVSLRLSRTVRGEDLVARLGGDEFAVLTSETADHGALQVIADRIIAVLCAPYSINGHTIVIGASIGIAVIEQRTEGAADILRYADMALYRAKNEGRNRACIYDAAMDADLSNRKLVEQDLRETIERDKLQVLYQPIVNASGETVVGVEALARWPHPARGLIGPADFIPIAEHSGLIIELGAWVLRRACIDGKAWPKLTVAVNVSPLQFRQLDFVTVVERILAETGFDPARLELELTETTLIGNLDNAEIAMRRLKALGVRLALDDFGTGYSSLHYLRRFPFDKLKIDRSFVLSIEKAADAAAIVHAVVSLGRGLGMKVTAEGVETADQHLFLRAAGVHSMQGFRFGRPSPAADIAALIATPGVYRTIEGDAAALAS
jgi:diguanylate cyclase (GGDEF)-like protein